MGKGLLFVLSFFILCQNAVSQSCASFYLLQHNKTAKLVIYNSKGNENGTILIRSSAQPAKGSSASATLQTTLLDKEGKPVTKGASSVNCNNGTLLMDMSLFLPQQQTEQFNKAHAKVKNVFLEYPAEMKPGDKLKDGLYNIEIDNNGLKQILKMQILNRQVTGTERISTKAGTWDCITITYQVKLNIQTGPINIPLNYEATEWFAPGFGMIRSKSETGITEIVSIK